MTSANVEKKKNNNNNGSAKRKCGFFPQLRGNREIAVATIILYV